MTQLYDGAVTRLITHDFGRNMSFCVTLCRLVLFLNVKVTNWNIQSSRMNNLNI